MCTMIILKVTSDGVRLDYMAGSEKEDAYDVDWITVVVVDVAALDQDGWMYGLNLN